MSPRLPDPRVRLDLVEAAARLLDEHGPGALTVRRLAGEVGASTQVVYTHFDGMDAVVAEVWREGFRRFGAALDEPAATDDQVADFMAQGWGYRRFALRNRHLYRVMFGDGLLSVRRGEDGDVDGLGAASSTFLSLLARIEACRDAGRWAVDDVFTAGEVVWATVHGHVSIELAGYFGGLQRDPEATYEECLRRLSRAFGDDPALVERSLRTGRRRARRAEAA